MGYLNKSLAGERKGKEKEERGARKKRGRQVSGE